MDNRCTTGYTLIEILIALMIFSIVSALTSTVLMQSFETKKKLTDTNAQLETLQVVYVMLAREITQITHRAVRSNQMQRLPPFIGETRYVEFTRAGLSNPDYQLQRSTLARVALLCSNKTLIRRTWPSLDTPNREHYQDRTLLSNLDHCHFSYISQSQEQLKNWQAYAVSQSQKNASIPTGIIFTLGFDPQHTVTWIFPISEGLYGET